MGRGVLGTSHPQLQKAPAREGIILNKAGVLKTTLLVQLDRFNKLLIFRGFELPGRRKSDFLTENDSFWWGERLRTFNGQIYANSGGHWTNISR